MLPLKWPKRFSASSTGVPAAVVVPTVSPCATSRAVAVSSPERAICQLKWSSTQPEYMANRGTSGIAVSIAIDGSIQLPEPKLVRPRARAGGDRIAEGRLQPEAEGLGVERHDDVAVCGHCVLDRGERVAPVAEQLRGEQRLLGPERGARGRTRVKPPAGGVP